MLVPYQMRISEDLKAELKQSAIDNKREGEKVNENAEVREILRLGLKERKRQEKQLNKQDYENTRNDTRNSKNGD